MTEIHENEPSEIRIDQDGKWSYRNNEMQRKDIIQYFYDHLHRDQQGFYYIKTDYEQYRIQVDDVPYVIRSISLRSAGIDEPQSMIIDLSDGSCEELNPETLWIGDKNVVYCLVKQARHEARFSRPAYYQLAENIRHDSNQDRYFVLIGQHSYPLDIKQN